MASPAILFLDEDISFLKRLSKEFRDFGYSTICKTSIHSITDLLEIEQPVGIVVCNLELGRFEGLTIHAALKNNQKFAKIPFVFVANDPHVYDFIKNMNLDDAIVVKKEMDLRKLTSEILSMIKPNGCQPDEKEYALAGQGPFGPGIFEHIRDFCQKNAFTGILTVKNAKEIAVVTFLFGQINNVLFKDFSKKEALEKIERLNGAAFILEQKLFKFNAELSENQQLNGNDMIGVKDVLVDLFYFVHQYFEKNVGYEATRLVFSTKFSEYQENFNWFSRVIYDPEIQEKVSISGEIFSEQIDSLVLLLKEIFTELSLRNGNISMEEFLAGLQEIKPYLLKFDLWHKLIFTEVASF